MNGIHVNFLTVIVFALAVLAGPLTTLVTGWRRRADAQTEKLKAEAEAIKNPTVREVATAFVSEIPSALDVATKALAQSRDHVVAEVTRVNPQAGSIVGTLIDAALATPPVPLPPLLPLVPLSAPAAEPAILPAIPPAVPSVSPVVSP